MAKGQQRSNREVRKPKAEKAKPAAQASPFGHVPNVGNPKGGAGKKSR